MTEQRPAVELADSDDDEGSSREWLTYGAVAAFFAAITSALAFPGVWDEYVVGYSSRRYRGLVNIIEAIGYWPIIITLGGIALAAAIASVVSFIKHRPQQKD